jgi:L-ribulokinase
VVGFDRGAVFGSRLFISREFDSVTNRCSIGLDFGTESVRVLVVDVGSGAVLGTGTHAYRHGVIHQALPGNYTKPLPPDYALQHPGDWLESAAAACRAATAEAAVSPEDVVGIGVDFTSCTMLPCLADGTPLCLTDAFAKIPLAWPKLWKHHGAVDETDRMNDVARKRGEPWLNRYGGAIGLEWFFPKVLETLNRSPEVYRATDIWLEAGDWFVWQLVSGPFPRCSPARLVRSTCQAGYKACWSRQDGYPSDDYLAAVAPELRDVVARKMPGTHESPGTSAGALTPAAAEMLGLRAGTPVSTAIIDAHAGVPGAGVAETDVMVLVMGTSSCHMMNSRNAALVPGVAGVVEDGILPGYWGYETGQASVGDAFAWVAGLVGLSHQELNERAAALPAGSGGVLAIDWLNGCRTPLMDGRLSGGFIGLTLSTRPEQLYRAMMEATAFGLRWICDTLKGAGVPVRRFVASGGLPAKSPLLMQIYADVLGAPISRTTTDQPVALGAAILGCAAAGAQTTGHVNIKDIIRAMAPQRDFAVHVPDALAHRAYDEPYRMYRALAAESGGITDMMRRLRASVG